MTPAAGYVFRPHADAVSVTWFSEPRRDSDFSGRRGQFSAFPKRCDLVQARSSGRNGGRVAGSDFGQPPFLGSEIVYPFVSRGPKAQLVGGKIGRTSGGNRRRVRNRIIGQKNGIDPGTARF